jgi:predicted nucleic acid-binding protein
MSTSPLAVTLDASVIMNAVNPAEAGHATSQQLLTLIQTQHVTVIVPTLVLVEVAATISRVLGDTSRAQAFARHVSQLPVIRCVPLSRALALASADLAAAHRLRGADAVYASVAQRYGTTLISLDGEHLRRLTGIVPVLLPADAVAMLLPPSTLPSP